MLIQSSAENSASPAFVRKRAGAGDKTGTTKLRLIIEMRNLNENCCRDATPLPFVANMFNGIGNGDRFFANLDLVDPCWNWLELAPLSPILRSFWLSTRRTGSTAGGCPRSARATPRPLHAVPQAVRAEGHPARPKLAG